MTLCRLATMWGNTVDHAQAGKSTANSQRVSESCFSWKGTSESEGNPTVCAGHQGPWQRRGGSDDRSPAKERVQWNAARAAGHDLAQISHEWKIAIPDSALPFHPRQRPVDHTDGID